MEFLIGVNGDGTPPIVSSPLSKHPHISNTERSQKSVTFVSV